jgi:hypothetical protein
LDKGVIDGYVCEKPGAISAVTANPSFAYVEFADGKGFVCDPAESSISVGLRKDSSLTEEINEILENHLNERLAMAGIEVVEARINYLAYAPEIAAVMLRRQQASAVISAREKIVEGAVSMVKMALDKLSDEQIVELDDDKKAAMVSNLLVVLCADEQAQPVVNTGTLYN